MFILGSETRMWIVTCRKRWAPNDQESTCCMDYMSFMFSALEELVIFLCTVPASCLLTSRVSSAKKGPPTESNADTDGQVWGAGDARRDRQTESDGWRRADLRTTHTDRHRLRGAHTVTARPSVGTKASSSYAKTYGSEAFRVRLEPTATVHTVLLMLRWGGHTLTDQSCSDRRRPGSTVGGWY